MAPAGGRKEFDPVAPPSDLRVHQLIDGQNSGVADHDEFAAGATRPHGRNHSAVSSATREGGRGYRASGR